MAERRMFARTIIDSDAFLDMPLSTQVLYFHLNMRADDDGFVNNPKRIQRTIGASDDDLKLLLAKRFLICFESGVIVIKHWRMHNLLRKDRYSPTLYQKEFSQLEIKENGTYTEQQVNPLIETPATIWQPNGNQMATQDRIGKDRIGKDRIGKDRIGKDKKDTLLSTGVDERPLVYAEIINLFNEICVDLPKVKSVTDERKRNIVSAAKVLGEVTFEEYFKKVHASNFLCGRDGKWQADFNWVIKKGNVVKVLEGNYDNRETKEEKAKRENREAMERWLRGEE